MKERTQLVNVRLSPDLKVAVTDLARVNDRSMASMVEILLREALAARRAKEAANAG